MFTQDIDDVVQDDNTKPALHPTDDGEDVLHAGAFVSNPLFYDPLDNSVDDFVRLKRALSAARTTQVRK
jgi:hypothetical protein